jgi:hypothetical protein
MTIQLAQCYEMTRARHIYSTSSGFGTTNINTLVYSTFSSGEYLLVVYIME